MLTAKNCHHRLLKINSLNQKKYIIVCRLHICDIVCRMVKINQILSAGISTETIHIMLSIVQNDTNDLAKYRLPISLLTYFWNSDI